MSATDTQAELFKRMLEIELKHKTIDRRHISLLKPGSCSF